ncbi:stringent starvation protein B [Halospina denitrificans]|uniref:Stringent starvation protein B n=1 Tax=Halospina denitrificans TaxID=332522 RepID=A0A4R7JLH6_9GAMM|nr:ClpXP protease specificity-enhancing factor [Halospina denitrificans]TDT37893.1 stringent starvation protein B [Halospina denitrificans]
MKSSRPYLIRALNEWILDNGTTPHLVVDASLSGVQVPMDYVANGQIVLNISSSAVKGLLLGDEAVEFNARFGGVPVNVYVPVYAVMAIYARENGQGMVFGQEPGSPDPDGPDDGPSDEAPFESESGNQESDKKKPNLKVVK